MKRKCGIIAAATALIAIPLCFYSFIIHTEKNELVLQINMSLLSQNHFNPPEINDSFSEKVYAAYIKLLDPNKLYFTKEDLAFLAVYRTKVDDQIKNNAYELYDLARDLFDKRFAETQQLYRKILAEPFNFEAADSYETDISKTDWAAKSTDLEARWKQHLKYHTLLLLSESLTQKEKASVTDSLKHKSTARLESEARLKLQKILDANYAYILKQPEDYRFAQYMNAITSVFDPYTEYIMPTNNDGLDVQMPGQLEGIGAKLQVADGYAKVVSLVPGGPAAEQGELKVNDLIITIKQENAIEAVNIFGMLYEDIMNLINGKGGTKVTLTVKRIDGNMHDITIVRKAADVEDSHVRSAVLTSRDGRIKAGYIYLPDFYADFKSKSNRSCSDDVAKAVQSLSGEGVTGIILDLRGNIGTGSMQEAARTGSLFLGNGPFVQAKFNVGLPRTVSDNNEELFGGPLVVLVNSLTASASEMLAAALQDYKRAVIIGGPQTYGKGTIQMFEDLDENISPSSPYNRYKPLGGTRFTIQKVFRIDGSSLQVRGVIPDIVLPDPLSEYNIGERYKDNYMPWTSISAARFKPWKKPVNGAQLRALSTQRTAKSEGIEILNELNEVMKLQKGKSKISLKLSDFRKAEADLKARNHSFAAILAQPTSIKVSAPRNSQSGNVSKSESFNKFLKKINEDTILEEAVNVLGDI